MHELRDMPERHVIDEFHLLRTSIYVFRRNYSELMQFLDFYENNPANQDLWHMTTKKKKEQVAHESVRLLHNFVAAAMSLRDLTLLMHGRLHPDGSFPEYGAEAARRFKRDPVVQFVQNLRHCLLHIKVPLINFEADLDVKTGHADIRLALLTADLLKWDEWKSVARKYLEDAGKSVHIRTVVGQYEERIRDFYVWYGDREQVFQDSALARFRAKEEEYFLLHIEDTLDSYFAFPNSTRPVGDRGLFLGLFDLADFEALKGLPAPSAARTRMALDFLSQHVSVPDHLREKIERAYSEQRFFTGTA